MAWAIANGHSLDDVLSALSENREVHALESGADGQYRCVRCDSWDPARHTLGRYRPVEPFKSLLFPPRERLGVWGEPDAVREGPERIVFGVKNCDLSSLVVQDHVFLDGDFEDPFYKSARDNTIVVTSDCTGYRDVCFCPTVGEQPHPEKGFDINISLLPDGCVIETGTERGVRVLQAVQRYLQPADEHLLSARDEQRAAVYKQVADHTAAAVGLRPNMNLREAVADSFESALWEDFAADCVECGACNFICCTCHCFLLSDGVDAAGCPARSKTWDACLFANFARTAGGGNPRARRAERLRNRFDKKFIYFPQVLGTYACDGCGRCTEACIGKIDIRRVLKRAMHESGTVHADSRND